MLEVKISSCLDGRVAFFHSVVKHLERTKNSFYLEFIKVELSKSACCYYLSGIGLEFVLFICHEETIFCMINFV